MSGAPPASAILDALLDAFLDSWGRHDATALAATVAPDGELTNFGGRGFAGRPAIQGFFSKAFQGPLQGSSLHPGARKNRLLSDSVAVLELRAVHVGARDPKGAARPDRPVLLDGVATRNPSGGWWFAVLHLRNLPAETAEGTGGTAPE